MAKGTLIIEGLRLNVPLETEGLRVTRVIRKGPLSNLPPGQPPVWTFVEFEVEDSKADAFAALVAAVLDRRLGWYCDMRSATHTFVVFADRIFRHPRGDRTGHEEAAAYGRAAGLPESQLDWPE